MAQLIFLDIFNSAVAEDISPATAFEQGAYSQASHAAEKAGDYELAIRAALIHGGYVAGPGDASEWLNRALTLSEKALSLNSEHMKNRLSFAMALSYAAKREQSPGQVMKAKKLIERLIVDYPDEAMSHGALAGWHSEVSASGFLPRLFLGAKRSEAKKLYKKALDLDNNQIALNLEYAKFLARGNKSERTLAENLLAKISEAELQSAFEQLLQDKAQSILLAVRTGNKKKIKRVIADSSAFSSF